MRRKTRGRFAFVCAILALGAPANAQLVHDPDIDDDGVVTPSDLGLLRACFGAPAVPPCENRDLNDDGRPDLVLSDAGRDAVRILLGNGDGGFQRAVDLAVGHAPREVYALDLSGDGTIEIVTWNGEEDDFSVLARIH